jgi:hypothetical protein
MKKTDVVQVPMQTRAASVSPSSIDADKRTVELVWSTGSAVRRMSWAGEYIEELSMDPKHIRMGRLNGGAPLLNTHSSWDLNDVIGVVEKAWTDGNEGRAVVRFSSRPETSGIWQDVQDGIIRNVSVGYQVHKFEVTEADTNAKKPKIMRAIDWEPVEISMVPVGADAKAGVRAEATETPCEVVTDIEEMSEQEERSEELSDGPVMGRAAPPAQTCGDVETLRRMLDLSLI